MDESKRSGGCSMAAFLFPLVLAAAAVVGVLGALGAVVALTLGAVWFLVKWLLAPFTLAHCLLKGGARRRESKPNED